MAFLLASLPEIWPWLILIAAQVAGWRHNLGLAFCLLAAFGGVVMALGRLDPLALGVILAGLLTAAALPRLSGNVKPAGHLALILWALVLGAHLLPGVRNLKVLQDVHAGSDTVAYSLYLNLDKPLVFFALLLACPAMIRHRSRPNSRLLILGLAMLPLLFMAGLASGAIRWQSGLPNWWLVFALSNLFLTCLAEEAFFRGYLQSVLSARFSAAAGVIGASALFGLAHIAGGPALALFAGLLGLACGLGYQATGRLWVPVAMHFGFNFAHLALFTYPAAA